MISNKWKCNNFSKITMQRLNFSTVEQSLPLKNSISVNIWIIATYLVRWTTSIYWQCISEREQSSMENSSSYIVRGNREGGPTAHSKNFKTPFFKRYWKILSRGYSNGSRTSPFFWPREASRGPRNYFDGDDEGTFLHIAFKMPKMVPSSL